MRLVGLDISTKTGWSLTESGDADEPALLEFGLLRVEVDGFNVNDHPEKSRKYPKNIFDAANKMAGLIKELVEKLKPDHIVIENTVKAKNRATQRILEFIHKAVLDWLIPSAIPYTYMDPSEWRSILDIRLSKDQKKNNRLVSQGKKRGRIGRKHLSIAEINKVYGLKLLLKDNDAADSLNLNRAMHRRIRGENGKSQ